MVLLEMLALLTGAGEPHPSHAMSPLNLRFAGVAPVANLLQL